MGLVVAKGRLLRLAVDDLVNSDPIWRYRCIRKTLLVGRTPHTLGSYPRQCRNCFLKNIYNYLFWCNNYVILPDDLKVKV